MFAALQGSDLALVAWIICAAIGAVLYGFAQAWAAALTSAAVALAGAYFFAL